MASPASTRSPRRIRRWLQATALGTVLFSGGVFGLIAFEAAHTTRSSSPQSAVSAATVPAHAAAQREDEADDDDPAHRISVPAQSLVAGAAGPAAGSPPASPAPPRLHARTRAS